MTSKVLSSLQHPIVKHLSKLRAERSYRLTCKSICIMGKKIIEELPSSILIKTLLLTPESDLTNQLNVKTTYLVSNEIIKKITGLKQPEPYVAEISMPESQDLTKKQWVLGLNGMNDPGNLGTILRTALALGWEGVFITEDSVDPYNDKALRAAKGATLRLPIQVGTMEQLMDMASINHWNVCIADVHGTPINNKVSIPPILLILGSESHGTSPELKKKYPLISIPISQKMESLNVAVASGILMYQLRLGHGL